jgi:ribosomal protein L40E
MSLVYCTKCGAKNEEGAEYCSKCGANLEVSKGKLEKPAGEECFGLPHGGAIVGLIIGIIIIIVGLSSIPGIIPSDVREGTEPYFWAIIITIFGALIIAGALYNYSRRK